MASAATLVTMMDGLSSIFLQVAEYKESNKLGSFMALSSSLGTVLLELHRGIYNICNILLNRLWSKDICAFDSFLALHYLFSYFA